MAQVDTAAILQRIEQLLEATKPAEDQDASYANLQEASQSLLTLYALLYGPHSGQAAEFLKMSEHTRKRSSTRNVKIAYCMEMRPTIQGALRAVKRDVESGLVGRITLRAAGEVLGDMLGLAKEALEEGAENRKNVAAVLVAGSPVGACIMMPPAEARASSSSRTRRASNMCSSISWAKLYSFRAWALGK